MAWWDQILLFFSDGQFLNLLVATIALFIIMFVIWWIYRALSNRNLFNVLHHELQPRPTLWERLIYGFRYIVMFPLYSFLGFLVFSLALFVLAQPETTEALNMLFFIAIVLVSTIRISSYVHENLAEDLAKMMPLSLLAAVILNPSLRTIGGLDVIGEFFSRIPSVAKYLVFIVMLEVVLRILAEFLGGVTFTPEDAQ